MYFHVHIARNSIDGKQIFFFILFDRTIVSENNRIELFYDIRKVIEMILGRDVYYYSVNKNRNMGTRNLHIHVPRSRSTRLYYLFFFLSLFFFFILYKQSN